MNLVDSCGWLEYLADGPHAAFFAPALENIEELIVPTPSMVEAFKRFCNNGERTPRYRRSR
jgi:hypothetical protein